MTTEVIRKIVHIDEDKCNGCGVCIPSCAEGALQIIDGKAKLLDEKFCDGLGACLGECPQDAITVEERESVEFDEEAVKIHLAEPATEEIACGCPSATVTQFSNQAETEVREEGVAPQPSMLGHWPVQLTLVPPTAPFLRKANLLLAADCVPFAYPGFHQEFLQDHALLVACPKLDDFPAHLQKLTEILSHSQIMSLTVVHMEVPCCSGLTHMARQAIQASGRDIPIRDYSVMDYLAGRGFEVYAVECRGYGN